MQKVKKMVDAGVTIPTAIKELLGMSLAAFAAKYGLSRSAVTNQINGGARASDDTIAALITELGGTVDEWRELLWLASKPASLSA